MPEFSSRPAFEIARRIELRGTNAWLVVIAGGDWNPGELVREVRLVVDVPARSVSAMPFDLAALRNALRTPTDDVVVVTGLGQLTGDNWTVLDVNRSALERTGAVILSLSLATLGPLNAWAPNLRSFIGGSIFILTDDGSVMSDDERRLRLEELELAYGLTDEEVIRRASEKNLPAEPDFAEWLILLGRGDLV